MQNIRAANQIYTNQVQRITLLEGMVIEQEKQVQQLTLAYEKCRDDWKTSDAIVNIQDLRLREKDAIISKQSNMIRVALGIVGLGITYTIYREVK